MINLCFITTGLYSQSYRTVEETRLNNVAITETAIVAYIAANITTYQLTPDKFNKISNPTIEGVAVTLSGVLLEEAIDDAKKTDLRALYFKNNPLQKDFYYALPQPPNEGCFNEGFENGNTAGYSFRSKKFQPVSGVNTWNSLNNFLTSDDIVSPDFTNSNSIVSLQTSPTTIYGVPTMNEGTRSIRLNNSGGGYDVTSLRKEYTINSQQIAFDYRVVFLECNLHKPNITNNFVNEQTYFQCRLLDSSGVVVYEKDILANLANATSVSPQNSQFLIFGTPTNGNPIEYPPLSGVLYPSISNVLDSRWQTEVINTSLLLNQTVTLEITIADCGGAGHNGMVFLDNFCNLTVAGNNYCPDFYYATDTVPINGYENNQAHIDLIASNKINTSNYTTIYHAGSGVKLIDGFYAMSGSMFHAYNLDCSTIYQNKGLNDSIKTDEHEFINDFDKVQISSVIKKNHLVKIVPNPNNGVFKVIFPEIQSGIIEISNMLNNVVFTKHFEGIYDLDIDLKYKENGIYILKVTNEHGNTSILKVVKQ